MFLRYLFNFGVVFVLLVQVLQLNAAHAIDRDVRDVITTSLYGMGAGTMLGVASLPLTQKPRSVFIGTSIGLYLGIIVGFYFVENRYDPANPLRPLPGESKGDVRPGEDRDGASLQRMPRNLPASSVDPVYFAWTFSF